MVVNRCKHSDMEYHCYLYHRKISYICVSHFTAINACLIPIFGNYHCVTASYKPNGFGVPIKKGIVKAKSTKTLTTKNMSTSMLFSKLIGGSRWPNSLSVYPHLKLLRRVLNHRVPPRFSCRAVMKFWSSCARTEGRMGLKSWLNPSQTMILAR